MLEGLVAVLEGLVVEVVVGVGLLRYQRKARKPTIATAISCGMLIEVCVSAILAGRGFGASWGGGVWCLGGLFGLFVGCVVCANGWSVAGTKSFKELSIPGVAIAELAGTDG